MPEAKEDWARGGCAGASFGPPLPQDLCQILSKSWDCALSRTCIGPPLPKTYARSFPRVGIVRFRAPAFTAFSILRLEHGRLGQSSLPAGKLEAKSSESKRIGPRVGVRGPHLVPLCPETYARSFPIVGIVRFAHAHWSPLPRNLCQIISNSRDCALRAAAFTAGKKMLTVYSII